MEKGQTLPEYLKELRRSCRYKQEYVASKLNIARQTYSHYETGRIKPPAGTLHKLAHLYGISIEELFDCMEETKEGDRDGNRGFYTIQALAGRRTGSSAASGSWTKETEGISFP